MNYLLLCNNFIKKIAEQLLDKIDNSKILDVKVKEELEKYDTNYLADDEKLLEEDELEINEKVNEDESNS